MWKGSCVKTTVVAGNPKPGSRTLDAATLLATELTGSAPDHVVDVVTLGPGLLGWGDGAVKAAVDTVAASDLGGWSPGRTDRSPCRVRARC